jgi:hypothetical protein
MLEIVGLFLESEYAHALIEPNLIAKIAYAGVIFTAAWSIQSRKVRKFLDESKEDLKQSMMTMHKHFESMEQTVNNRLGQVVDELSKFKTVVREDLNKGDERMNVIENRVSQLEITKGDVNGKSIRSKGTRKKTKSKRPY